MEAIGNALEQVANAVGSAYGVAVFIQNLVLSILVFTGFQHVVYTLVGLFTTRKFKPAKKMHKYAICIAARNEETVIGNLLESIKMQDYPSELLTVFVVADNCTDNTAAVARDNGAVCYERFDDAHRTKGYALEYLFDNIKKDYGIEEFEGYFIFDSDNLLNCDYVSRMNEAFDEGEKIITSYRNTKNLNESWLAASYAIHWLRSIRFNHRARSVLRLATNIQGTGFLFANELVKDGWHYTSLTEDRAFTADAVAHGYAISYCDAAMFYDEQPTKIKVALRQRLRWSKGHLLAFVETGPKLLKNIFVGNVYRDKSVKQKKDKKWFIEQIRCRFASYDTLIQLIPGVIIKTGMWLIVSMIIGSCYRYTNGYPLSEGLVWFAKSNLVQRVLNCIFGDIYLSADPGIKAMMMSLTVNFVWNIFGRISFYFTVMLMAIYVFITERKRIIRIPWYKKILYCLTWPTFEAIGRYTSYIALFMRVEWKPIPHTSTVTIDQIEKASVDNGCGKKKDK